MIIHGETLQMSLLETICLHGSKRFGLETKMFKLES